MGNDVAEEFRGGQIRVDPAELTAKKAIRFVKLRRCPTLGTLIFNNKRGHDLILLTALRAKFGIPQVFRTAARARFNLGLLFGFVAATGAEFGIGC